MDFSLIEKKWQTKWEEGKAFAVSEKGKKFYCLEMFPYPSGSGLHMGHALNYTIGDIYARYKRMCGYSVLYPMGYDSFGLPAENAAIKAGGHPKTFTHEAIRNFIRQQKDLGLSYDWSRMLSTCEPEYYRWNQYLFLQFYKHGLVYRKKAPVNWCPLCDTVLANEQVHNGKCWRHKEIDVETKELEQWFLQTTKYADELYESIDALDWPDRIKVMQKNWIGKSEGLEIDFSLENSATVLTAYTTRCDTVYSVTFLVLAPEHLLCKKLVEGTEYEREYHSLLEKIKKQSSLERTAESEEKFGCFLGNYALHPLTGERLPIYAADFVLLYGTGIVMADAHDQRDYDFALKYKIPLKFVISPDGNPFDVLSYGKAFLDDGILFDSGKFSGMYNRDALAKIADFLVEEGCARKVTHYKLRDWLISRQRYWGTPIPFVYCASCGLVPLPEDQLPVLLPEDVTFGKGNPLLTNYSFVHTHCPSCGGKARRETDTMDTFFDSSWYFLRYCDPQNEREAFDSKKVRFWMPVDQYIGGAEHACMHLIYARFFTKALRDLGYLSFDEPFTRLFNQGMLHGDDGFVMSKSRGNVVLPEEISQKYGIDTARLFLVSVASPDKDVQWSDQGIEGTYRFTKKVMQYFEKINFKETDKRNLSKLHKLIRDLTKDIEEMKYNLVIIKLRDFFDNLNSTSLSREDMKKFVQLLSPFAPHLSEELWEKLGGKGFCSLSSWPQANISLIDENLEYEERFLEDTRKDIYTLLKLVKKDPQRIVLFVSPSWKYAFFKHFKEVFKDDREIGSLIVKTVIKGHEKEIAQLIPRLLKDSSKIPEYLLGVTREFSVLDAAKSSLSKEFGVLVEVYKADDVKENKAQMAMPGKVSIFIL